jgi:hypothetical protein
MAKTEPAQPKAGFLIEVLRYLWRRKLWWMVPMIVVLVLIGALLAISLTTPAAPFVYTLF